VSLLSGEISHTVGALLRVLVEMTYASPLYPNENSRTALGYEFKTTYVNLDVFVRS